MKKNKVFSICDVTIQPGEFANLALPLPEQYSCSPLFMPIKVIHGKEKGPCVLIFSVLQGNELNGLEISNRIVEQYKKRDIAGTLIAIPVVNVYGLTHYPKVLPSGKSLESCFPGSDEGSYGERMAALFTEEVLKKADVCVEFQTGGVNHNILPQVYCDFENAQTKELAKAFQTPVITSVDTNRSSLRETSEALQIPLLVYKAGEALRFDENAIDLGVNGVKNVMSSLGMLTDEHDKKIMPIPSRDEEWLTAHIGGVLHSKTSLGQTIKKGESLGNIADPFRAEEDQPVYAPQDGVVVGINTAPLVYEGLPIFKIASFVDDRKAESLIEKWDKNQPGSYLDN